MLGRTGRSLLCVGLMFGLTAVVQAQPYTTTVDFNDDLEFPEGEEFIWQSPAWSGSTQGIVCTRGTGGACIERDPFDNPIELSQRVSWSGLPSPAVEIFWVWDDPANTSGVDGVRATTAFSDNMSRPSMHLGGKLRFKIAVSAWNYNPVDHSFDTQFKSNNPPQAGDPSILLALGVKETGNAVPQGDTDNGSGDIEFVYLPGSILPTTTNGLMGEWPPMGLRIYAENDDWPPDADDYQQVEFDFGPGGGLTILGFANDGTAPDTAGDGVLDATTNGDGVNRGPMEALFFTNDAADTQGQFMFVYIDDVEFVSNVIDPVPTPTVEAPIYVDAVEVVVSDLIPTVDRVELWKNSALLDSIDTNGVTEWTFTIAAAQLGDTYTAKQRDSDDGRTSDESQGVTVIALPFPGPPINAPPVAGTSGVEVIGIDSTATEVEVYVSTNGGASYASLGTAPVSGGQTSLTFTAPAPLIMGDMLQATMRVEGDESDPSGPVTVTTNGLVVEYANDFEGYADQAAFEADGWVTGAGDTPLELNTNGNATLGGNQSLYAPMSVLSTDAFRSQRTLDPRVSGTDTHPLVFTFNYYDTVGAGTILRHYCELRDYVSDQTGLNQIVAAGTTSNFSSGSETIDINYYMGRIVFSSAGYFNLDGPTSSQRSIGWHTITAVILSDTVDFYLDGILADRGMVRNGGFGDFNNLYLGSGATSYNGAAWFDDVSLTTGRVTFPEMAPTVPIAPTVRSPILEDETTVRVTGVAEDATGVDVFAD
ncbi:MAG: hypothetical protein GY842_23270, partial [bacterium]|nr:hypothetical protein [bacterium]